MPQPSADQLQAIPMSPNLGQSLARAKEFAREQAHRALLLEHLLLALTEDPEASGVLRACNVDIVRLGTDVSGYLGRLTEDMRAAPGNEPAPDAELLRVIEAARQAAQQSRRRAIDGAIVLAAIVGDGKSPAAGLLKTHGMTFDEAIKTLQRASAQARSKQYAPSAAPPQPEHPAGQDAERERTHPAPHTQPAPEPAATPPPPPSTPPPAAAPPASAPSPPTSSSGQSVDDILAAARARIQQRSTGAAGAAAAPAAKPEPKPTPNPAPKPAEPPQKAEPELPLMNLSSFAASPAPPPPDMPDLPEPDLPPRIARTPGTPGTPGLPPTPRGASPAPPLPPGAPQAPPFRSEPSLPGPADLQRSGGGAPRPPPQPPPRRPERAPRGNPPNATEPHLGRPAAANGALGGPRWPPPAEPARPAPVRPGAPPRSGQRAAAGPLLEAIPRRMRAGVTTVAQVRVGRDKVGSLIQLLAGGRAPPSAGGGAHVLTVRLKAPEGGVEINAESPETQWVETGAASQQDDPIGWRWSVTPQQRGRHRLLLVVAARTVDREGIGPEVSAPDRVIEVTVRPDLTRRLLRWGGLALLVGLSVAIGRFSQDSLARDLVDVVIALWNAVVGLLVTSGFLSG